MRRLEYFKKGSLACLVLLFAWCIDGVAETEPGPEEIVLNGGKLGEIHFPHRRHQHAEPPNCQTCHALFPQAKDSIALLKEEGTLPPKQVMNGLCIKCHKETAKTGNPSGPQSCTVCHAKNNGQPTP